ncbi:MAG TPA: HAD family hydrolase [Thermoanaerobaculia bacterium]|nr:HAD family hydrolase [Thermoanaerobaculia bacterium]
MPAHHYRAVILDMDGTLIDSNAAHVNAWVDALREHGYEVAEENIWPLVGMGGDNLLPAAVGIEKESAEGKKISDRRSEIFKTRYVSQIRPFPGVRALLERIRKDGLRLVIASSSPADELEKGLEIAGVADLLEESTSASDAGRSKPDPDVVKAALDRLGLPAGQVVMLGDTPYDIQAAGKVSIGVIAFRCGGFKDEDLEGALAIYDGPWDLLARYQSSPLVPAPTPAFSAPL